MEDMEKEEVKTAAEINDLNSHNKKMVQCRIDDELKYNKLKSDYSTLNQNLKEKTNYIKAMEKQNIKWQKSVQEQIVHVKSAE